MSQLALCLFLFAILQYGIQNSSQEENSTKPEPTEESKKDTTSKETVTEASNNDKDDTTKTEAERRTTSPLDNLNPAKILLPGNILEPVKKATGRIGDVVAKGMDSAKDVADGAFNFFKNAVTTFF